MRPLVEAKDYKVSTGPVGEGLSFRSRPELAVVEHDHERRPAVLTSTAPWSWRGRIPRGGATLHVGVETLPAAWRAIEGIEARVVVRAGREREVLAMGRTRGKDYDGPRWLDIDADLAAYEGREVTLDFSADLLGLPASHRGSNLVAWSPVSVSAPTRQSRPNILFILVDTLRRDHLTPYGYARNTSPEIARRIARSGVVMEDAYSQAPWTLPSVVSLMTGREPGEILGADLTTFGIPEGVDPLAVRLGRLGYTTGGFLANPTLHSGAGFERGFATFFAPPPNIEWIHRHADSLDLHVEPWLRAHQDRPFFLYVHYIDPHDPYDNPEIVNGRSPFLPGYDGPVNGQTVHDVYTGNYQIPDMARDLPQIQALYDSEIHYADRYIGKLLSTLSPAALKNTLIVFTADHGEEHFDHGGWKHGQSVYEEQVHVPLLLRWDGHFPAGSRIQGTVRLLDLLPTLVAAAGGPADPSLEGGNLLPVLSGKAKLAEQPAFAQHLAGGPLRATAVLRRQKLNLFNPLEPFTPKNGLEELLWKRDLGRLQPVELYDLTTDPKEKRNLWPAHPELAQPLSRVIHRRLDFNLPGLKVMTDGAPSGSRLTGTLTFAKPPARWVPYFLGSEDKVELAGTVLRFDLRSTPLMKGFRVEGDYGTIESVAAALDGRPLPGSQVRIGRKDAYAGGPIAPQSLLAREWPGLAPSAGGVLLWVHDAASPVARREHDAETERALRALGYIE
ncbi:MAG TPA: sulfatase-like hydrolase/transferase [Thermoanaerobaculia bacterium]|nr:sulfatase-like hydrolase/transferase [Thermoanaerobaculia bacterium]